jgi:serine protease Do
MKQILNYVLAGVFGGLIVFGGIYLTQDYQKKATEEPSLAQRTNTTGSESISKAPFDFVSAAERTVDAVVHIHAKESRQMAQQRLQQQPRRNPFSFFFGDEGFGNPFFDNRPYAREGTGSGVIMDAEGFIVTNNHVVEFADEIEVTLHDNRKFTAKVIGKDPQTDIAVLKIEASGLKPILIGDSDAVKVGEWVVAVGNPFNLTSTVTSGIVSAKGRRLELNRRTAGAIEAFIQTDAAVNPGNSGGALVDIEGRLVGINTAIASPSGQFAGYAFAIPVNIVTKIVEDLIEYGEYQRAYLGVGISDLDADLARELKVNISQGVVIQEIYDGGSAQYAGLLPNDIIVKAEDRDIKTISDLQEIIGRSRVGDIIMLQINRGGKDKKIEVKLRSAL